MRYGLGLVALLVMTGAAHASVVEYELAGNVSFAYPQALATVGQAYSLDLFVDTAGTVSQAVTPTFATYSGFVSGSYTIGGTTYASTTGQISVYHDDPSYGDAVSYYLDTNSAYGFVETDNRTGSGLAFTSFPMSVPAPNAANPVLTVDASSGQATFFATVTSFVLNTDPYGTATVSEPETFGLLACGIAVLAALRGMGRAPRAERA